MRNAGSGQAGWGRSTALLAASATFAQVVLFLGTLVAARLYTPLEYGAGAAFIAVIGVVGVASALRYDVALPVAGEEEAPPLLVLCIALVLVVAAGVGAFAIVAGPELLQALNAPEDLAVLRFAVPGALAVMGLTTVLSQWATRREHYPVLARTRVVQTLTQVVAQAGLGLAGAGAAGLVAGAMMGACAGLRRLARDPIAALRAAGRAVDRPSVRRVASRYRAFSALSLVSVIAQGIAIGCAPLLVGALYGLQAAGWYALAQRVVAAPMRIIGEAAARTFFGEAAMLMRGDVTRMHWRLRRTAAVLGVAALLPTVVLLAAGPALFSAIFGTEWRPAGEFARPLCVLAAAQLVAAPVLQTLVVVGRLGLHAALAVVRLVAITGPLVAAHALGAGPVAALTAMSLGGAAAYAAALIVSDRLARLESARPGDGGGDANVPES